MTAHSFQSIQHKLLAIVLLTTLIALVAALAAMIGYDLRVYHRAAVSDMTAQAEFLGTSSAAALAFNDPQVAGENLALLKLRPQVRSAAIYNERGRVFASYARPDVEVRHPDLPESDNMRIVGRELAVFKRIVKDGDILGTVHLRADYEIYDRILDYLGIAAIVLMAALLIAYLTSASLQKAVTRPILAITRVAREVMEQRDYSRRAEKLSADEIGTLVDSFNGMLEEIERRTRDLEVSNAEVLRLNEALEGRVRERTNELESANKELESFSYSVSHDLRSPLRAVDGFSRMLEEDYADKLDAEGQRLIGVVRRSATHMAQLIDDLLRFSQLGRKPLAQSPLDMKQLAGEVIESLRPVYPNARVELGDLPAVSGDRALLRQVWTNLVGNALKYSALRTLPYVEIGGRVEDAENLFWVRDNGTGFDMRYYDKLFKVFQRLHGADEFEGTGVGLAIVQRIVGKHGGRVWAESGVGEGACFRFALPRGA